MRIATKWLATIAWFTLAIPALPVAADEQGIMPLPDTDLFHPLLADPKQPRFQISYLRVESDVRDGNVAAVGFGENFGIIRWPGVDPSAER